MIFPHGETVTVRNPVQGADDPYGQPTFTWSETHVVVAVAPTAGDEANAPYRQDLGIAATLYVPTGTAITGRSRVVLRSEEYEVHGEPGQWTSPFTGWAPGIAVNIKRTEG